VSYSSTSSSIRRRRRHCHCNSRLRSSDCKTSSSRQPHQLPLLLLLSCEWISSAESCWWSGSATASYGRLPYGFPVAGRYGVALCHDDLRHLVLSDRAAVDVALAEAAYLRRGWRSGGGLFSLRPEDGGGAASLALAEEFALGCPRLQGIWEREQRDARVREDAHWDKVQRGQAEARRLRRQQAQLESEESRLRPEGIYGTRKWDEVRSELQQTKSKLHAAETAPEGVVQPLPQNTGRALLWLFFLRMPTLLRHLSRASFLAQQMLLPRPVREEVTEAIRVGSYTTNITSFYNSWRHSLSYQTDGPSQANDRGQGDVC
jgi:hypothetical protein